MIPLLKNDYGKATFIVMLLHSQARCCVQSFTRMLGVSFETVFKEMNLCIKYELHYDQLNVY